MPRVQHDEMLGRITATAQASNCELLSTEWKGQMARYTLRCQRGHVFDRLGVILFKCPTECKQCRNDEALARLQAIAESNGGKCLEKSYLGKTVKHRFVCANGHKLKYKPQRIHNGSWCHECGDTMRGRGWLEGGLERLQEAAHANGGKCLSTKYDGIKAEYKFRCAKGHVFDTVGGYVFSGGWCRTCGWKRISDHHMAPGKQNLLKAVKAKGGKWLDKEYTGMLTAYHFRCKKGHEWETAGRVVAMGGWCKQCNLEAQYAKRFKELKAIAHERGGALITEDYLGAKYKMRWECHRGHQWLAIPTNIRLGTWCPECARMDRLSVADSKARHKYLPSPHTNG